MPRPQQSEGTDQRDRELLGELVAGRPEVLAELFDRHGGALFRHGLALCRRQADAEDLVQATFLKLATTGADLAAVKSPASYLHRTLHTTWLDSERRKVTGDRVVEHAGIQYAARTLAAAPGMEDALDIVRALETLPVSQREAIVLHLVEGFSFREIGRATGVSLFTAAARYRLGLGRLRKRLGHSEGGRA